MVGPGRAAVRERANMSAANENRAVARHNDPIAQRDIEVERTIATLEREFGTLGTHERIVVAREIDALVNRVAWTFDRDDW
jgi:hypothetical protein